MRGTASAVGLQSLAVELPSAVRTNDWFRERHPAIVATASERTLARLWDPSQGTEGSRAFDAEMEKYLRDPFRGAIERRVLGPGETALDLEVAASRGALAAAQLEPDELDLAIVVSFRPDQLAVGNAAFLARALGLAAPAWNLETACSGATVALHTAADLVRAGAYRRILVAVSCVYSRDVDEEDTLGWFMGDGAAAFVVGAVEPGTGILGRCTVNTAQTCGAFAHGLELDAQGRPAIRMRPGEGGGRMLRETSEPYLRTCTAGALADAGLALDEIDFFVFNTPVAWFAAFAARVLAFDPALTLSTYPRYANVGPVLMPVNLHQAAASGRIAAGDRVLLYSVGSVSTASAVVIRWGDVALAPLPPEGRP